MAKKEASNILNRRALYDYQIHNEFVVGIVLSGREVKAARDGHVQLKGSYVTIRNSEIWLINASFSVLNSSEGKSEKTVETGPRKLLAHAKEIQAMKQAKDQGLTIVPLSMNVGSKFIKLKIATAKGKKVHDKRESIKKRDIERENRRKLR